MLCLCFALLFDLAPLSSVLQDASTSFMLCVVIRALTTRQSRRNLPQYQSKCTNVLKVSDSKGFLNSSNQFVSVLLPVWGRPAPLAAEIPAIVTTSTLFAEAVRFMVPFNYADLPLVVVPAAVSRCRGGGACPYALRPRAFQLVGRNEATLLRLAAAYELERGELAYPLDPKSSDAGAATLLFGGALLTLTAVVAGAFFLVLV